jgi:DNA polymerase-2
MSVRGFILQTGYRIESGRPVVQVAGKLDDGRSFLLRDTRQVPHFWIRASDADRARAAGARVATGSDRAGFAGEPLVRVEVNIPPDVPPLRDRLSAQGIATWEADVRFGLRLLIDRGIRGSFEIEIGRAS